jgi:hypothetical protein
MLRQAYDGDMDGMSDGFAFAWPAAQTVVQAIGNVTAYI